MTPAIAEPPTEEQPALTVPDQPAVAETGRFLDLATAVRRHETMAGHAAVPKRPADHALYRLLTELERA